MNDFLEEDVTPPAPAPKVVSKSGGSTTTTTEKESGLSKVDVDTLYNPLIESAKNDYQSRVEAIEKEYEPQITDVSTLLKEAETKKAKLAEKDEDARKKDKAYSLVAGLGDAISGVANLVGTTKGAVSQKQAQALPAYMEQAEAMRKERKLDAETIEARRKELETQRKALRQSKDKALTTAYDEYVKRLSGVEKSKVEAQVAAGKGSTKTTVTKETEPSTTTTTGGKNGNGSGSGSGVEKEAIFTDKNGVKHTINLRNKDNWKQEATSYLLNLFDTHSPLVAEYQTEYSNAIASSVIDSKAVDRFLSKFLYGPLVYEYLTK